MSIRILNPLAPDGNISLYAAAEGTIPITHKSAKANQPAIAYLLILPFGITSARSMRAD